MAKLIPNQNSYVGFLPAVANLAAPTVAELTAGANLTRLITGLNASASGQAVPTPSLDSLFETSVPGTSQATFTVDCYRDDAGDLAWVTLPRNTHGFFVIQRFGNADGRSLPIATAHVEVWPVTVLSRAMANMTSGTVETFTVTCSVPVEPNEAAIVSA